MHWLTNFFKSQTWQGLPVFQRRIFFGLLAIHLVVAIVFTQQLPATADESDYFGYAGRWARGKPERIHALDDSKSPIVLPAILPVLLRPFWKSPNDPYGFRFLYAGRRLMYVYPIILAFFFLIFSVRLGFKKWWLFGLALLLFDPTILGFCMLVGSDVAVAALLLGLCYCLWQYLKVGQSKYLFWKTLFTGLLLVAKASMIFLIPFLGFIYFIKARRGVTGLFKPFLTLVVGSLLIINLAYYFNHSFFKWKDLPARSKPFKSIKQGTPFLNELPVPLPYPYVDAFDLLSWHEEIGAQNNPTYTIGGLYLLGKQHYKGPVWYFYIIHFLFKIPLVCLILFLIGVGLLLAKIRRIPENLLLTALIPVGFMGVLSFFNPFQTGIRHAFLFFPVLYGTVMCIVCRFSNRYRYLAWLALMGTAFSLGYYWNNFLTFTNLLIWNKTNAYKYISDSSLGYGEYRTYINHFLKEHEDFLPAPSTAQPGKFIVPAYELLHPFNHYGSNWLQEFEPFGSYRFNLLLFDISENDLAKKSIQ